MSALTINLEIGHNASLREKTTSEGFTHDWDVFVQGSNGAEIKHYVDRVVFHLHETFERPKRVVKEPPYCLKTSGYAGFNLPIQIYLKNSQEPRKIQFNYDLRLQPSGPPIHEIQKEKYTFYSVNEDFRNKLLKGGAISGSSLNSENSSNNSTKPEEKPQMTSKPRLSGLDQPKKYKLKQEEPRTDQFTDLFGTPITKTSRAPEVQKKEPPKQPPIKSGDKILDKDKNKNKPLHKERERDRDKEKEKPREKEKQQTENEKKSKDDKKDKRDKKDKDYKKDKKDRRDRDKEKEKDRSPILRPKSASPKRSPKRPRSPSPAKTSSNKEKETTKDREPKDSKDRDREKEKKFKKHKEKESKHKDKEKEKDRDRDKDKGSEHNKEYKNRDNKSSKEKDTSSSNSSSVTSLNKEKERDASPVVTSQSLKPSDKKEKVKERDSKESEKAEETKPREKDRDKEKNEDKPKHKHKKKDKDRKDKRDKEKEDKPHKKDREEKKQEKDKGSNFVSKEITAKERDKTNNLFGSSPKSEPSPNTLSQDVEQDKPIPMSIDDDSSNASKVSSRDLSPMPENRQITISPAPSPEAPKKLSPIEEQGKKSRDVSNSASKKKDKKEKKKEKKGEKENDKKRKRKVEAETQVEIEEPALKIEKKEEDTNNNSDDERKVSSTEDAKPIQFNDGEAYMSMLRDLQTKIMGLKEHSDLQRVVQLIAETGRYEVSAHTFDFDLCLLDRSTVMQLQSFFSNSVN